MFAQMSVVCARDASGYARANTSESLTASSRSLRRERNVANAMAGRVFEVNPSNSIKRLESPTPHHPRDGVVVEHLAFQQPAIEEALHGRFDTVLPAAMAARKACVDPCDELCKLRAAVPVACLRPVVCEVTVTVAGHVQDISERVRRVACVGARLA